MREKIYENIRKLDPKGEIVKINLPTNKIEYNEEIIKLHEFITELTNEEIVRAFLVVKLIKKLGYTKKQCIELEKLYTMGRDPKKGAQVVDYYLMEKQNIQL